MLNSILFRCFLPGYLFQALRNIQLVVGVNQPRALKTRRGLIAPVPGRFGIMNLAGNRPDTLTLIHSSLWNR